MTEGFEISGHLSSDGARYIRVAKGGRIAFLPQAAFGLNRNLAETLSRQGLVIFDKDQQAELTLAAKQCEHFEPTDFVHHVGWTGNIFAMPDGTVYPSDKGNVGAHPTFCQDPEGYRSQGKLSAWKKTIAGRLADQPVPAFIVMATFLPPLLRLMPAVGNVVIELVGRAGVGKSTIRQIAASVMGGDISKERVGCAVQADHLLFDPQVLEAHRDLPLIVEGLAAHFVGASKAKKSATYKAIVFDLAKGPGHRVTLLTSRQPLKEACSVTEGAATMITLPIPNDAPFGVFGQLPDGCLSAAVFAEELLVAARAHHGHAYKRFIKGLAKSLKSDEDGVRSLLERWQSDFLLRACPNGNDGTQHHIARAFAAIYAAGKLATRYKALPKGFNWRKNTQIAYRLYLQTIAKELPFADRLNALISSGKIISVTKQKKGIEQTKAAKKALGTVMATKSHRLIMFRTSKIEQAFPDWAQIKSTKEVRALLKMDGRNLCAKGTLAPSMEKERLFQFRLPLIQEVSPPDQLLKEKHQPQKPDDGWAQCIED